MALKLIKQTTLNDLEPGSLFIYGECIGFKSQYFTDGRIDAFILGSGELFIGGEPDEEKRRALRVWQFELNLEDSDE